MKTILIGSKNRILKSTISFCFILILFCSLWGWNLAAGPVVLKMASFEPSQSFNTQKIFVPLFKKINRDGDGIIKIDLFSGGLLGRNPLQSFNMLKNGIADLSLIVNAYQPGKLIDNQVINSPFMGEKSLDCTVAMDYMRKKGLLRGYEDLVIVGLVCLGQYTIHTNFPVRVPNDLKGKKIRTAGKLHHSLVKALGATPIAIPSTKTAESISRGIVSGTIADWNSMDVFRINDVAKYHCLVPFGTTSLMVSMMKEKYDSLSPQAKKILSKNFGKSTSIFWATKLDAHMDRFVVKTRNNSKHHIYTPNDREIKLWKNAMNPVVASWKNQNDRWQSLLEGYKEGLNLVEE